MIAYIAIGSAVLGALGSLQGSGATAGVHDYNRQVQVLNSKLNIKHAKVDAFILDKERRALLGANIASAGSNGFVLGHGSIESILSSDINEQYKIGLTLLKGQIAASQDLTRAAYNDYQAEATRDAAPIKAIGSALGAAGGVEGVGSIYGKLTGPTGES